MIYIQELIIAPSQEEHIWRKHRVTPEEVEEVCAADPWVLHGRDGSYAVYGRTEAGRFLVAFLYPRGQGVYTLATARELELPERRRYQKVRRK